MLVHQHVESYCIARSVVNIFAWTCLSLAFMFMLTWIMASMLDNSIGELEDAFSTAVKWRSSVLQRWIIFERTDSLVQGTRNKAVFQKRCCRSTGAGMVIKMVCWTMCDVEHHITIHLWVALNEWTGWLPQMRLLHVILLEKFLKNKRWSVGLCATWNII